jgi:hypothetical protein
VERPVAAAGSNVVDVDVHEVGSAFVQDEIDRSHVTLDVPGHGLDDLDVAPGMMEGLEEPMAGSRESFHGSPPWNHGQHARGRRFFL